MDILAGEKFEVANMKLIYWTVRLSSGRGGDGVKWVDGEYSFLCQLRVLLYQRI